MQVIAKSSKTSKPSAAPVPTKGKAPAKKQESSDDSDDSDDSEEAPKVCLRGDS
jgi:hypothetical protein